MLFYPFDLSNKTKFCRLVGITFYLIGFVIPLTNLSAAEINVFVKDGIFQPYSNYTEPKKTQDIRLGIGGNLNGGIFFPNDFKDYVFDIWDELTTIFYVSSPEPVAIFVGGGGSINGTLCYQNIARFEGWYEYYVGTGAKIMFDVYSTYSSDYHLTLDWSPFYNAYGVNVILTPGANPGKTPVFFSLGGGLGSYNGTLNYVGDLTSGSFHDHIDINYTGSAIGFNGLAGINFAAGKNLEFDLRVTGKYAKIPKLKGDGEVLTNPYRNDKTVALDFSSIGISLGMKLLFP